jgi:starch-binding outer membrane protein, SusD/RagB family
MKKLLYISSIAALFFIAPSCSKKLDVLPQNSVTPDQIKTSADVVALLAGAYSRLQYYGAFGEQFMLIPDLMAADDQVNWVGTYSQYRDIQKKRAVSTNSVAGTLWGNSFTTIDIVNTVLDKLALVDSGDRATVQGEALFMRGTMYFELAGLFGKPFSDGAAGSNLAVPIVLLPTYSYDSSKNNPSRSTVAQVYTQAVKDLVQAVTLLPESNGNGRADKYSAKGILSRVYLSMGDYTNAAIQANDVIQSGNFKLTDTYAKAFNNNNNSTEDLFAIQETTQSNAGTTNQGISTFYAPNGGLPPGQPKGRGDAQIDQGYYTHFEPTDDRVNFVLSGTSIAGESGDYPDKWQMFYKAIPVVRLAEMYLTRGEANLAAGTTLGATPLSDINTIRNRANATPLTAVAQSDFVEERFRELGFEGDRFWTLKRLKMDLDGLNFDADKLIMPVPQSEIDVNKNLVQNSGY